MKVTFDLFYNMNYFLYRMVGGGNREMLLPYVHPLLQQEAVQVMYTVKYMTLAVIKFKRYY